MTLIQEVRIKQRVYQHIMQSLERERMVWGHDPRGHLLLTNLREAFRKKYHGQA